MQTTPPSPQIARIVVLALVMGVITFALISIVVPASGGGGSSNVDMLRLMAAALAIGSIPVALLVRMAMLRGLTPADDTNPYRPDDRPEEDRGDDVAAAGQFFAATIIGCALLEGTALFVIVVSMISGSRIDLVLVAPAVILMLVVFFPTDARWRRFTGQTPGPRR